MIEHETPAQAAERVIEESRRQRHTHNVGTCQGALNAAEELSKIGTSNKAIRKRMAALILWLRGALQQYAVERDQVTARWAERDPETQEIKIERDDKGSRVIMRNDVEATLEANALLFDEAKGDGPPPAPFTYDELDEAYQVLDKTAKQPRYVTALTSELAARLGPFIVIE